MRTQLILAMTVLVCAGAAAVAADKEALPEAGPANDGLRLRLLVVRDLNAGQETFDVRVDLINTTDRLIPLIAAWEFDSEKGSYRDYLESSISIETSPSIKPWQGQTMSPNRALPQPRYDLAPGETLTINWRSGKRQLKNRVTNPLSIQNPQLPLDGLYSVHAVAIVLAPEGKRLLRSNEQLVSIGGSREMPKSPYGKLWSVDAAAHKATLSLGSLDRIAVGDRFDILVWPLGNWCLEIDKVEERSSRGKLSVLKANPTGDNKASELPLPRPGADAQLIVPAPPPIPATQASR